MMDFERLKGVFLNLFYPRRATCLGCGDMLGCDRDDLCEDCRVKLAKSWIGLKQPSGKSRIDTAAYAYGYHGPAGMLVRNLKYRGAWLLAEEMGRDIARAAMLMRIENICYVAAVPMHPKRLRQRGKNHAELLARVVAEELGLEYVDMLMRTRNARQQARLSAQARKENMCGAFAVREEYRELVNGAEVLIIDDVFTTGATAASCAKALKDAGVDKVYFAAYANGERKKHG